MKTHARSLLGLHLLLALYSVSNIFSKLASEQDFLSWQFVVYYGMVLVILAVYAIGWQQTIKRMPLTTAYANKAVTVVWGIVFGVLLFGESITAPKVIGAALIVAGVVWFGIEDGRCQSELEAQMRTELSSCQGGGDIPGAGVTSSGAGNTCPSAQTASAPESGACRTAPGVCGSGPLPSEGDVTSPSQAAPASGAQAQGASGARALTAEGEGRKDDVGGEGR